VPVSGDDRPLDITWGAVHTGAILPPLSEKIEPRGDRELPPAEKVHSALVVTHRGGLVVLQPKTIIEQLKKCGITHVVWLPDSESKFMYDAMQAEKDLGFIPVCREGEAFAVASGLWMGGKTPVVLFQNTGLFESGDVLRGTAIGLELPLLMMIGYRGYMEMKAGKQPFDTAAVYTEPILNAWEIPFYHIETDADTPKIAEAFKQAQEISRPVAALICVEYNG
jgi:sulfopyruvate decarboxylase subunit alpha